MNERPILNKQLDSKTFRDFYYLKSELVDFCRENGLPTSGGKIELTDRIAHYLDTGNVPAIVKKKKQAASIKPISIESIIEPDIVCSEQHRAFFKKQIGEGFTFNVSFQRWLKANAGKTYGEAIAAYYEILDKNNRRKSTIDSQFEYNTYIRDFFADNKGKSLQDAIRCWKYKKSLHGHNRYEKADLVALK